MYRELSRLYPTRTRAKYKTLLTYCDIETPVEMFIGKTIAGSALLGLIFSTTLGVFLRAPPVTVFYLFIGLFLFFQAARYLLLILRADGKGRFVEEILPDALLLMSMNIRSGMTTDRALIIAARPEFGPLEKELTRAGKQILAGKEVRNAMLDMSLHIRSSLFDRTLRLIIEGIESGGELSSLLQQTAEDIQNTKLVHNEVRSNLLMYGIFIFFACGFGAPLLFGISTYLVSSVGGQLALFQTASVGTSGSPTAAGLQVGPNFLVIFALLCLTITSFFGGLIIGVVKGGSEKSGIKLVPLLIIISYSVFFAVRMGVSSVFPALT